jgi:hypothetical protein
MQTRRADGRSGRSGRCGCRGGRTGAGRLDGLSGREAEAAEPVGTPAGSSTTAGSETPDVPPTRVRCPSAHTAAGGTSSAPDSPNARARRTGSTLALQNTHRCWTCGACRRQTLGGLGMKGCCRMTARAGTAAAADRTRFGRPRAGYLYVRRRATREIKHRGCNHC